MSQVSLKDLEIVGLKNQTKNIEDAALKKEEERKALEKNVKICGIKMINGQSN